MLRSPFPRLVEAAAPGAALGIRGLALERGVAAEAEAPAVEGPAILDQPRGDIRIADPACRKRPAEAIPRFADARERLPAKMGGERPRRLPSAGPGRGLAFAD